MLLSNRRRGLIYLSLAGMEIAWITPFVALLFYVQGWEWSPIAVYGRLFALLLVWMLALESLNRLRVDSPRYELAVLGLIVVSSLLLVRFWLYGGTSLGDFGWLPNILTALFNIHLGLRPELVLILTSLLLWQRAASATSRSVEFFSVGVSFRLGILLLIVGAGLLNYVTGQNVTPLVWPYFGLGLTAVALARIQDKAAAAPSAGRLLPLPRLAQLLAAVGFTVGGIAWLSLLYTPDRIRMVLGLLKPLWILVSLVLIPLLEVLLWLLQFLLIPLEWLLRQLVAILDLGVLENALENIASLMEAVQRNRGAPITLPPWVSTGVRYGAVLLAILVVLGFILLYLGRMRSGSRRDAAEEEGDEAITLGGETLGRGVRWLRDMARLVRRHGLSRQLLAAVSVQNIYANLCRLASRRGYPRHPAQPPDDYLPVLAQAFSGQEEPLARITNAYMQVHYGEQPVTGSELTQIRRDYDQVRMAESGVRP